MPWTAGVFSRDNGTYSGSLVWQQEAGDGSPSIQSANHDTHDQDLADGINACLLRNGQNAMTGDLDLGGNSILDAASATVDSQYMTFGQMIQTATLTTKTLTLGMPDNTGQADLTVDLSPVMDDAVDGVSYNTATDTLTFTVQGGSNVDIVLTSLREPTTGTARAETFFLMGA